MIKKEDVIENIRMSVKPLNEYFDFSTFPGVYAFLLNSTSTLKDFGKANQVLYVGIAKDSLKNRDLGNHLNSDSTGRSTLRRSIGAILKTEFNLKSFSRNGTDNKREIINYVFNIKGDTFLTKWMTKSLLVGFWEDKNKIPYTQLRDIEEEVIKILKPTLDLDKRTRKYNPFADKLDGLRTICRIEARENTMKGLTRETYAD